MSTSELVRIRINEIDSVGQGVWLRFQRYHVVSVLNWRILAAVTIVGVSAALLSRRTTRSTKALIIGLSLAFVATWIAMAAQWPFTAHGRFLLPAGLPLVLVASSGLATAFAERTKVPSLVVPAAVATCFSGLLLVGVASLSG